MYFILFITAITVSLLPLLLPFFIFFLSMALFFILEILVGKMKEVLKQKEVAVEKTRDHLEEINLTLMRKGAAALELTKAALKEKMVELEDEGHLRKAAGHLGEV